MTKETTKTRLKIECGDISFGTETASTTIVFPIPKDNGPQYVGDVWSGYRRRRLNGKLVLGDDDPDQQTMDGKPRLEIPAAFDTFNPSFTAHVSLRIQFGIQDIDPKDLLEFRHENAWLIIDTITDIPAKSDTSEAPTLWNNEPTARLGIDDAIVKTMFDGGVKTVGQLVDVFHDSFGEVGPEGNAGPTFESLKVPKGRVGTIRQKLELFFENQSVPSPLEGVPVQ